MGLFNNTTNAGSLTPSGLGSGPTQAQQQLFANAAQDSGLSSMGMGMVDQMTGGDAMENEDQVKLLYQLMAAHPNQVALFFHDHASFLPELANLIGLIVRKEVFAIFNSDMIPQIKVNSELAATNGYSTITQENIDAQLAKVLPPQEVQAAIQTGDMQAMQLMNGHQQQMMMGQQMSQQQQQQQWQEQQWQQQQMVQQQQQQMPQRGIGSAVAGFGSSLIRGSLGLPPAQARGQQPMGQQPMGQQPQGYPRQF
jgi:hypothetical protein